jgi:threonine synthase
VSAAFPGGSRIVCGGCGAVLDPAEPYPFRCPNVGDGGDHVLRRELDLGVVEFPHDDPEPNPFVRYRSFLHAYHMARGHGMEDEAFVSLVRQLDAEVARVDGHGFSATPLEPWPPLGERIGLSAPLWVKDETGNVAGSHKARHLFGLLLHLEVAERLGLAGGAMRLDLAGAAARPDLAIASCGNAALAAAVVAAAGRRRLRVFVPVDADPRVVARLRALDADVRVCRREPGVPGDPTVAALRAALAAGAQPFTCQGDENGLAIEGGETIGYEMVASLAAAGAGLDDVVIQVGGGALASSVAAAFAETVALRILPRAPRLHTVQTEGAWPLKRAFDLVAERLPAGSGSAELQAVLRDAARRRSAFMWPWETTPCGIAQGILDDETYDWLAVVGAMLETGGRPVVVSELALAEANALAVEATGITVDATGSAGLAGLSKLRREGVVPPDARVALLFTGVSRDSTDPRRHPLRQREGMS